MTCTLAAVTAQGEVDWVAADLRIDCAGHAPALADLDADGRPEVILARHLLNGEDGSLQGEGQGDEGRNWAYAEIGTHAIAVDQDAAGLGYADECDESNNVLQVVDAACP